MTEETFHDHSWSHARWWAVGFGLGALVGATAGILFAPSRGRDTRERIASASRSSRARVAEMIASGRGVLADRRARVDAFVEHAGDRMRAVGEQINVQKEAAKSAFERVRPTAASR